MNFFSIFFSNLDFTDRTFNMKGLDQLISCIFKESIISFEINQLKQTLLAKNILTLIQYYKILSVDTLFLWIVPLILISFWNVPLILFSIYL